MGNTASSADRRDPRRPGCLPLDRIEHERGDLLETAHREGLGAEPEHEPVRASLDGDAGADETPERRKQPRGIDHLHRALEPSGGDLQAEPCGDRRHPAVPAGVVDRRSGRRASHPRSGRAPRARRRAIPRPPARIPPGPAACLRPAARRGTRRSAPGCRARTPPTCGRGGPRRVPCAGARTTRPPCARNGPAPRGGAPPCAAHRPGAIPARRGRPPAAPPHAEYGPCGSARRRCSPSAGTAPGRPR